MNRVQLFSRGLFSRRARLDATGPGSRGNNQVSESARAGIMRASEVLGHSFVALRQRFEPLAEEMVILAGRSDGLSSLAGARDGGQTLFQKAVALLHGPLDYIDSCVAQQPRLLGLLAGCADEMRCMLAFQSRLQDILAPLSFVEILFKVESASLEIEHRETFVTVAADIQRLRNLVNETFRGNTRMLASTHATLVRVRHELEVDFQVHARTTAEKRKRIATALAKLDEQLAHNGQRDSDVNSPGRQLSGHVAAIVSGIQHHENVTQECSHVLTALTTWNGGGGRDEGSPARLVARLESVQSDVSRALDQIQGGITGIHGLAKEIHDRCPAQDDFHGLIAAADGMVQMLLDAMTETHEIIAGSTRLLQDAHTAVLPAGDIASTMTTALGELSINMKLVALNAQVRSVQLSCGTGLEVLAVRTAEISHRITEISTDVSQRLGHLRSVTDEMFSLFQEFRTRGDEQTQHLEAETAPVGKGLHHLRDQTLLVFTSIGDAVDSVARVAEEARIDLDQAGSARGMIGEVIESLRGLGGPARLDPSSRRKRKVKLDAHATRHALTSGSTALEAVADGRPVEEVSAANSDRTTGLFGDCAGDARQFSRLVEVSDHGETAPGPVAADDRTGDNVNPS